MTPQEKAKDLLRQFSFIEYDQNEGVKLANPTLTAAAKQCALIALSLIFDNDCGYFAYDGVTDNDIRPDIEYWEQVKKAITEL